jgi:hypothetical protein
MNDKAVAKRADGFIGYTFLIARDLRTAVENSGGAWRITCRPTTQRFCELLNDAPDAAIKKMNLVAAEGANQNVSKSVERHL